jgi:hypothetical protein
MCVVKSVAKFTSAERSLAKSILATLSIKKIPDLEIIKEIERQTNKSIGRRSLYDLRQSIKKESYEWYKNMREGQYSYIHEFKERINEIYWLQQYHHNIIDNNKSNPQLQQTSLAELHRLNITLSNYFDVAPDIINGSSIPTTPETKATTEPVVIV